MTPDIHPRVQSIVDALHTNLQPHSIFLYGSRARGDHKPLSDYEIGLVYKDKKIDREQIISCVSEDDVNVYSFSLESLQTGRPDTPFPPRLFAYEITNGGAITLAGEPVVETVADLPVYGRNVIARTNFDTSTALTAMLIARDGDVSLSHEQFYKSCLYGARCMLVYETGYYHLSYHSIAKAAMEHAPEFKALFVKALVAREQGIHVTTEDFHENIGFLSRRVRDVIHEMADVDAPITINAQL